MINWHEINNKIFEDIAYDYMTNNYPEITWKKTKLTNDGNKDGEGTITNLPLNVTLKYWYEAKYSINTNKSIPKSHLDSTLVSSLLDGHVVIIAFITNAYISDDYKRRADIFAKQRDNMRIIYINGEDIENWLSMHPNIEAKYLKKRTAQKYIIEDRIEEVCFLDKYDNDSNQFLKLSTLELDKEYFLYIRYQSSIKQQIELLANNAIVFLQEYTNVNFNPAYIYVEKGTNTFFVPIKITSAQNEYALCIKGNTGIQKYIIQGIKILKLYKPKLVIASQINLLNDINLFIKSNDFQNLIFLIIGDAGTGKTYILNMLRNNTSNPFASISLRFSGRIEHDIIVCYKLFIYCQFGNLWELNINNLEQLNFHPIAKAVLSEINIGISSTKTYKKLVEYCTKNSTDYTEQNFLQQQIYIDDIHKISSEVANLLQVILEWYNSQRLNKRIFLFSRNTLHTFQSLNEFLSINTCCIKEIGKPTFEDIKSSIELNFKDIPSLITLVQRYQQSFNALYLYDFLCMLRENIYHIKKLDVVDAAVEISEIMGKLNHVENNKIGSQLLKEYNENKVFIFVYKLENGIDIDALIDFFGASIYSEISVLCQKRIVKEISGKLYPFHDILLESFRKKSNDTYIEELERFILFCIEMHYFNQGEGYSYLITLGGKYFWQYRSIAKKIRDEFHETANYFAAEKIAKKIQEENKKDITDYDYEDIRNLFILGNCYKYTTSYELSNNIFDTIKDVYKISKIKLPDDVLLETYSETINNNLWMLNIKKADSDLKKMSQIWNFSADIKNKSKTYKYGYLNYYNRRMFCNFMLGSGSEADYMIALSKATELSLEEYEGFAHMDYAKSIYNIDITKATKLLEKAKEIFERKGEIRRLLDASSELVFINILQSKFYDKDELEIIYHKMKEKKYIQSYTRTYLKILVVMLLSQSYTEKELLDIINNILIQNVSIASGKRHQALIYHVLAAIYYVNGKVEQSIKFSKKALELFDELGNSYKKIHQHNTQLKKKCNIILSYEPISAFSSNDFILDARIW